MTSLKDLNIPRIYVDHALTSGIRIDLPPPAVRHLQALRKQPDQPIVLFNGQGGEWLAHILEMGKNSISVQTQTHHAIEREAPVAVSLMVGVPVNERMDFIIEKATELGAVEIYPMLFEHSVFKLSHTRAEKKITQWQNIAIAACEQCGRNTIPTIHPFTTLPQLLQKTALLPADRRVLSLFDAVPWPSLQQATLPRPPICVLSGPEGGLSPAEEEQLISQAQFKPYRLGTRTLRADTAPIAALSTLTLL